MTNVNKKCEHCNQEFPPKGQASRAKYCGNKCRQKAYELRKRTSTVQEMCRWCRQVPIRTMDLYTGFCAPACERAAESYRLSGGACSKCGDLWLGERHCQKCGAPQLVTAN